MSRDPSVGTQAISLLYRPFRVVNPGWREAEWFSHMGSKTMPEGEHLGWSWGVLCRQVKRDMLVRQQSDTV